MKTYSHSLSLTGLRAVHNARSRIYVPGSDPKFSRTAVRSGQSAATVRVVPAFPDDATNAAANSSLWRQEVVDRLTTPLTRYYE